MVFKDLEITPKFKMLDGTYSEHAAWFISRLLDNREISIESLIMYYDLLRSMTPEERRVGCCKRSFEDYKERSVYELLQPLSEYVQVIYGDRTDGKQEILFMFPYESPTAIKFSQDAKRHLW